VTVQNVSKLPEDRIFFLFHTHPQLRTTVKGNEVGVLIMALEKTFKLLKAIVLVTKAEGRSYKTCRNSIQ